MYEEIINKICERIIKNIKEEEIDVFNISLITLEELGKLNIPLKIQREINNKVLEKVHKFQEEKKRQEKIRKSKEIDEFISALIKFIEVMNKNFEKQEKLDKSKGKNFST